MALVLYIYSMESKLGMKSGSRIEWFNKGVFQYYIFSETDKSSSANDSKVIGRCRNCRLPTSISGRRNATSNFIRSVLAVDLGSLGNG